MLPPVWLMTFLLPAWQFIYALGAGFSAQGMAFIPDAFHGILQAMRSPHGKKIIAGLAVVWLMLIVCIWFPLRVHFEKIVLQEAREEDCDMYDRCRKADPRLRIGKGLKEDCKPYTIACKSDPFWLAFDHVLLQAWDNVLCLTGGVLEKLTLASVMTLVALAGWTLLGGCCQRRVVQPVRHKLQEKQRQGAARALQHYLKEADL